MVQKSTGPWAWGHKRRCTKWFKHNLVTCLVGRGKNRFLASFVALSQATFPASIQHENHASTTHICTVLTVTGKSVCCTLHLCSQTLTSPINCLVQCLGSLWSWPVTSSVKNIISNGCLRVPGLGQELGYNHLGYNHLGYQHISELNFQHLGYQHIWVTNISRLQTFMLPRSRLSGLISGI